MQLLVMPVSWTGQTSYPGYTDLHFTKTLIKLNHSFLKNNTDKQKKNTILHELGHPMGLDHQSSSSSIMYPSQTSIDYIPSGDKNRVDYLFNTIHANESSSSNEEGKHNDVITVEGTWQEASQNMEQLLEKSDLVALVKAKKEKGSYQPFKGEEDTFTDIEVDVLKIVKGDSKTKHVTLSQYGGERPDGTFEKWSDLPHLEKGKYYLLFNRNSWRQ